MKMIDKDKECIGKYASKKKAERLAKIETLRTRHKHHAFLTHYNCPYTFEDIMCWTIVLTGAPGSSRPDLQ